MIEDRIPKAVCPLHDEYTFVGIVLSVSNVYDMTVDQFVGACMKANKAKRGMKESDYSRSVKSLSQKQRFDSMSKEQRHQHGMRSREGISEDGRISQTKNMLKAFSPVRQKGYKHALTTCPHCNKVGGVNTMKKYHFDKCKGKVS
jgi:hypothetical protein